MDESKYRETILANDLLILEAKVRLLLDYIAVTHGVENVEGFSCPYIRRLAEEIEWRKMSKDCKRMEAPPQKTFVRGPK